MHAGLPIIMRRLLLAGSFIVLLAALVLLWAHRFERVPGLPGWTLADLRDGVPEVSGVEWNGVAGDPVLRLRVDEKTPHVALRLALPGAPAVDAILLRHRMTAHGLKPGPEKWQTGRMMIEWHPPGGAGEIEQDMAGGIKLDQRSDDIAQVAVPEHGPAIPALRLEHLGLAGDWELSDLEIIAVQERALWSWGRWFVACGWLLWIFMFIRSRSVGGRRRAIAAASIWLLMGIHFVVPGPWKAQRSLGMDFHLGKVEEIPPSVQAPPLVEVSSPPSLSPGLVMPEGKLPIRGGLALRIKMLVAQARPLLHVLLLLGPVLVSALLVGRRPTLFLAVLLSFAIEGAQIAFGYGFDWIDMADLLTDAAGIALGLWLAGWFLRRGWFQKTRLSVNSVPP